MIEARLRDQLAKHPAVVLTGARQLGKTRLAKKLASEDASLYLDLQRPGDAAKLKGDAVDYLLQAQGQLIVLDEVQLMPGLFGQLRSAIDLERERGATAGKFLLLGSASGRLLQQTDEHLTGRVARMQLQGINLLEAPDRSDLHTLWERGGYPESLLATDDSTSLDWRKSYLESQVGRELGTLELRISAAKVNALLERLGHMQGSPIDIAKLCSELETARPTIVRHLEVLENLMLVRRLPAYRIGQGPDTAKKPKYYFCDSGLLHAGRNKDLLQLLSDDSRQLRGVSWEGFVIENLSSVLPRGWNMHYYRMHRTNYEIDLVLKLPDDKIWAVEIKSGIEANMSDNNTRALRSLKPDRAFMLHGGENSSMLANSVQAISLAGMMKLLLDSGKDPAPAPSARTVPMRAQGFAKLERALDNRAANVAILRSDYLETQFSLARELLDTAASISEDNSRSRWQQVRERILLPYFHESMMEPFAPERNQFYPSLIKMLEFFLDLKPIDNGTNPLAPMSFAGMVAYDMFVSTVASLLSSSRYETVRKLLSEQYVRKSVAHGCSAFWSAARGQEANLISMLFADTSHKRRAAFVEAELVVMLFVLLEAARKGNRYLYWRPYAFWDSNIEGVDLFLKAASEHGFENLRTCIGDAAPKHVEECIRKFAFALCPSELRTFDSPLAILLKKLNVANWWTSK